MARCDCTHGICYSFRGSAELAPNLLDYIAFSPRSEVGTNGLHLVFHHWLGHVPFQRHFSLAMRLGSQGVKESLKMSIFEKVYAHMGNEAPDFDVDVDRVFLVWRVDLTKPVVSRMGLFS